MCQVLSLVLENLASAIDRRGVRFTGEPMPGSYEEAVADASTFTALREAGGYDLSGTDLSTSSFFLIGAWSPDFEAEPEGIWGSNIDAFHKLAEYVSQHVPRS